MEEGTEARRQLKREFEEIYRCRSRAVHDGMLLSNVNVNGQRIPIGQFIERSQDLFKKSLLKAIESRRLPDWNLIELGG